MVWCASREVVVAVVVVQSNVRLGGAREGETVRERGESKKQRTNERDT